MFRTLSIVLYPNSSNYYLLIWLILKSWFCLTGPGNYQVIKCGSFGHNIRCGPSLKSTPVGMLTMDDKVLAINDVSIAWFNCFIVDNILEVPYVI